MSAQQPLKSNKRFRIIRPLGSGGMGAVYAAFDNERKSRVAVKTLNHLDPNHVFGIKQEFRQLSGLSHPNLIQFYDLLYLDENWFLSMELVDGVSFMTAARSGLSGNERTETLKEELETLAVDSAAVDETRTSEDPAQLPTVMSANAFDETLTYAPGDHDETNPATKSGRPKKKPMGEDEEQASRKLLGQLAIGLSALHRAGRLHCDVKPSNILVTDTGRVVILDFGLIKQIAGQSYEETVALSIAGTVEYMAPEQMEPNELTPACDWYSFGVILYQVLTGERPFEGKFLDVLKVKLAEEAPSPNDLVENLPEDLSSLCSDLLHRDPASRPDGREVLRRLGITDDAAGLIESSNDSGTTQQPFVGRNDQLARLQMACDHTGAERAPSLLFCHGRSGMGKSAMVSHFLEKSARNPRVAVLSSKCYEFESVPYKAFDNLIDNLSRFLGKQEATVLDALLPRDVAPLIQLFPALERVRALRNQLQSSESPEQDVVDLRRRAFRALQELLGRIGDRFRLILFFDDLQWGDLDSAQLLSDLLEPPNPPAMTVIVSYRSEDEQRSNCLSRVFELRDQGPVGLKVDQVEVTALSEEESCEIARGLLQQDKPGGVEMLVNSIAREADGNPYFLHVLCTYYHHADESVSNQVNLSNVLASTLRQLTPEARAMFDVIAIAGRPLPSEIAFRFVPDSVSHMSALHELTSRQFVKITGDDTREELEPFHDRVREYLEDTLESVPKKNLHLKLAQTVENSGEDEPEILAHHYLEGGDDRRAGKFFEEAATKASGQLAFERAAWFFEQAIDYQDCEGSRLSQLREKQAGALANAGRGPDAAACFLNAVQNAESSRGLELERKAALHYLLSGYLKEGEAVLKRPMAAHGLRMPGTQKEAIRIILGGRLRHLLLGYRFKAGKNTDVPADVRERIELLWTANIGLSVFDPVRASAMGILHIREALKAGDPFLLVRSLSWQANGVTIGRGRMLLDKARELAVELNDPYALGIERMCRGLFEYLRLGFSEALEALEEARIHFRKCQGVTFEIDTVERFQIYSLVYTGQLGQARNSLAEFLYDARERGDQYARINWTTGLSVVARLTADDPVSTRAELHACMDGWNAPTFTLQNCTALFGETYIDFYEGAYAAANDRLAGQWETLKASRLLSVPMVKVFGINLYGASKLQKAHAVAFDAEKLRESARNDLKALRKTDNAAAPALADHLEAGLCFADGDIEGAVARLERAGATLRKLKILHYAAAFEFFASRLNDQVPSGWVQEWIDEQGVQDAERYMRILCPGFDTPSGL